MPIFPRKSRRQRSDPAADSRAAVHLMSRIDPQEHYQQIPKIVSLMLSIDPRGEVEVLSWLSPVLGSIPWRAVRCELLSFQRAPVGKWCGAMLHPAAVSHSDRIVRVPYVTDDGSGSGEVAVALYPGDTVNLPAHRDQWYTVYEIRQDRNCILVATAEEGALPTPTKARAERRVWRDYKEINTIHFLGCTVMREVVLGPLGEVVDDWHPPAPSTAHALQSADRVRHRRIFFTVPKADCANAMRKLCALSRSCSRAGSFSAHSAPTPDRCRKSTNERPAEEASSASFKRKPKVLKQPMLFKPSEDDASSRPGPNARQDDPVESFQRKKHVQVWAARKMELSLAAKLLAEINPNPLLYTLDDTFERFGGRTHLVDSLQLARKRREVWLQVGRALRAVSRGGADGHVLLSAWKQWTARGLSARAAFERKIQMAKNVFGEGASLQGAETPDEAACAAAWYSQRIPTTCDETAIVEARTYIRKRIHELSKYNNADVSNFIVGAIYDSDGNMDPENCEDEVCQSILIGAAAASPFLNNTEAELHFTPTCVNEHEETRHKPVNSKAPTTRTIKVPAASYVCTRAAEYWQTDLDGNRIDGDTNSLEEVAETAAIIKRGDVLYLPMGKEGVPDDSLRTSHSMSAVLKQAPSKWCQVLAVDLLFSRLWVRPCSAAPQCWLDDAENAGVVQPAHNCYWLPVSLLWDAVVFTPDVLGSTKFKLGPMFVGEDVVKSVTKNGIQVLECRYKASNLPSLSSTEAMNMLRELAAIYPAAPEDRPRF